jgi:hypothetical protein
VTVLRIKRQKRQKTNMKSPLQIKAKPHYRRPYNQIIGTTQISFSFFQSVECIEDAPAVPDQPIKASTTYWLVRNNLRLFIFIFLF